MTDLIVRMVEAQRRMARLQATIAAKKAEYPPSQARQTK